VALRLDPHARRFIPPQIGDDAGSTFVEHAGDHYRRKWPTWAPARRRDAQWALSLACLHLVEDQAPRLDGGQRLEANAYLRRALLVPEVPTTLDHDDRVSRKRTKPARYHHSPATHATPATRLTNLTHAQRLRGSKSLAYDHPVDPLTALSAQFDPLRPLEAGETDLYVDWQDELDIADDVKLRLANSIARSPGPVTRLFTGHRGAGKTTELNRVRQRLQDGVSGRKVFVSMLFAERWVHLDDVQPEDLVYQIVRQLVSDLKRAGFTFAETSFRNALGGVRDFLRGRFAINSADVGIDPLAVSLRFESFPTARKEFRDLLQGLLPTIYDLTNTEILTKARAWLAEPEHGGYSDIAIIVDQLDRIPRKPLNGYTNHENLFLDHAGPLRSLNCDVVYTIPIELAYSRAYSRLQDTYGSAILTLPAIPVTTRGGEQFKPGVKVLREIVRRRAHKAGLVLDQVFASPDFLEEVLRRSGGHVRGLFVLLQSILDRSAELPITAPITQRGLRRAAADLAVPLRADDWALLAQVHESRDKVGEDHGTWNELLRDRFVLAYEDELGHWYDRNPLLELVEPGQRG